jgi:hypothetical protein
MDMNRLIFFGLSLPLIALFSSGAEDREKEKVDIRGKIVRITSGDKADPRVVLVRVLIEGVKEPDTHVDKALMSVTVGTKVFLTRKRTPADFSALKPGQKVEASFKGAVMESYPVQGTASEIVILEDVTP